MSEPSDGPLRDRRRPAFCYQTHEALDAIRAWYTENAPTRLTTALAVYLALTEAANRNGGHASRTGGFRAYRTEIAANAGVSVDTLDRYARDLSEKIGVLEIERVQTGRVNLPNTWVLCDPPSRTDTATLAAPVRPLARDPFPEPKKTPEEDLPVVPPPANRPGEVDGKTVTDDEYAAAAQILTAFNAAVGGQRPFKSSAFIGKIIMRIREHPDLTVTDHAAVIASTLAHPWWSGGRAEASPPVVYGNAGLFERCVHAAAARQEADPSRPLTDDELAGYGRVWGPGTPYATAADARAGIIGQPPVTNTEQHADDDAGEWHG